AQRANALKYSHALFKKPLTLEEYLSARAIAEPLHLFDCVMPCAGAEGFLVLSEERARALGIPFAALMGTIERHNAFAADPVQMRAGSGPARRRSAGSRMRNSASSAASA